MPTTPRNPLPAPFDQLPFWLGIVLMSIPFVGLVAALTGGLEDGSIIR